jgi:hypothetical protein
MAAVRALTRAELRSRWPALLGLVLLVALASGVILTAVVGARRTSSAAERFSAWSNAADATLQSPSDEEGAALYEKARELPYVKDAALRYIVNAFPAGADDSTPDFSMFTDPKGRYAVEIDRPRVLRGRMPDPNSPDEIAVDELTAELLGRDVGDHLHLATWTPDDLVALFDGTTFPGFNGPRLDLIVVGVTRAPYALEGQTGRATLTSTVGPRFLEAHPGVAAWPPVIVATVEDPRRDLPRLANDMGSVGGNEREADLETADEAYADSTERAVGALTTGLWVFALVAGLAAAVTVGQAVSRQVASASRVSEVTRALGLTRRTRSLAGSLPAVMAGVVGVVVGAAAAVACSPLLPNGLARRAEIEPGVRVDPWALGLGAVVAIALVVGWAVLSAWRAQARALRREASTQRPSTVATRLARWGLPVPVVTGVRHAFEGYGGLSVAVRSALVASTVAVAGVVAAGVVATSVDRLTHDPVRYGWAWSSEPDAFSDEDPTEALAADDRLAAVAVATTTSVEFGDVRVAAASAEAVRGTLGPVIAAGRAPSGRFEVALAEGTMSELDASIGDTVEAVAADGESTIELTVVGQAVLSLSEAHAGEGAVFTTDGLLAASRDEPSENLLLRYPDDADPVALEQALREDYELSFPPFAHPTPPAPVRNIDQGNGIAVALAAFFCVLGIAGLFHALTVSTRRRRPDFAVLRAMGFQRRQVRETVLSQATTIAIVGVIVGMPTGLILGRVFWARMVDGIGVLDFPTTPWWLLAVLPTVAIGVAAIVAWLPARGAARASVATIRPE